MARIYVSEYADVRNNQAFEPLTASQILTTTGASQQSAVFNVATNFIRVHTDGIMSILVSNNPTVTLDVGRMAAGQTEYFNVKPGDRLAYITNT